MDVRARQLLREKLRRVTPVSVVKATSRVSDMLATRYDYQRAFIQSQRKRKAILGTRRAGKSETAPAYALSVGLEAPAGAIVYYVAITRLRSKELAWQALKDFNERYSLGFHPNETELSLTAPGGAIVRLTGADKLKEAHKRRGDKCVLVLIDEAQMYPPEVLKALVDDVFGPTLEDYQGTIVLFGTPGIVCEGYWYELTRNEDDASRAQRLEGWETYDWNVLDNPFMAHMKQRLPELLKERGWTEDHPTYLREWRGRWVNDSGALFYRYDESKHAYDGVLPEGHVWLHAVGVDLGTDDAFSYVVWAFSGTCEELYEVESFSESGLIPSQWSKILWGVVQRFNPVATKVDTGGLGKAIVLDMQQKDGLPVEPAEKAHKPAYVALLNSDLDTGAIRVLRNGELAKEWKVLPKNPDNPLEPAPGFNDHASDAGLYGWREALHWLGRTPRGGPKPGSPEWLQAQEAAREARLSHEVEMEEKQREEW